MTKSHLRAVTSLLASIASVLATCCNPALATTFTPAQLGYFNGATRESIHADCKHITIIPLWRPVYPGVDLSASDRIEAALAHALQAAGFEIASAESYSKAYDSVVQAAGGLYNPFTSVKRSDVMSKAVGAGMKALADDPQFACMATMHIEPTKAILSNRFAYFNGATEFADGGGVSALAELMVGVPGTGTLPAISVSLAIYNRSETELFGRFGGIQLTTYIDKQHGDSHGDFLPVPNDALLLDDKRIARAMVSATTPLRYSTEQINSGSNDPTINPLKISPSDLPHPPPGSHLKSKPLLVPREQILGSVHRVALGLLTPNGVTVTPELATRYRAMVHERLVKLGWEVVDVDLLYAAFNQAAIQVGGTFNVNTGLMDQERLRSVTQLALKSLSLPETPDAFAMISLAKISAVQVYGDVDWDGTRQDALKLGPVVRGSLLSSGSRDLHAGEGTIAAASFTFSLRDAKGTLLVDTRGGVQLLQVLSLQSKQEYSRIVYEQILTNISPDQLFTDPARDTHAVDVALLPLLAPPPVVGSK